MEPLDNMEVCASTALPSTLLRTGVMGAGMMGFLPIERVASAAIAQVKMVRLGSPKLQHQNTGFVLWDQGPAIVICGDAVP